MKSSNVQVNATYLVKVAGNLVPVAIAREHDNGGWEGISVKTGKTIRIKSAQRLRKRLEPARSAATKAPKATTDHVTPPQRDTGEVCATGSQREADDAKPLGVAVSAGLLATTVLTLLIVPVFYVLAERGRARIAGWLGLEARNPAPESSGS